MSDIPIRERPYNVFVSYAHEDATFVSKLASWLTDCAGLAVWVDERRLKSGAKIVTGLPQAISQSASMLIVVSAASVNSGWVEEEYGAAVEQRAKYREFRILVVRLDNTPPPSFLRTTVWIDALDHALTIDVELGVLAGLYADETTTTLRSRDVYISRSWRSIEATTADAVCRILVDAGYRLIGDATDQRVFDDVERVPALIGSCGAMVAIVPNRNGKTSTFIEQEIQVALQLGVCCVVIQEPGVALSATLLDRIDSERLIAVPDVLNEDSPRTLLDLVNEGYAAPRRPHYGFYATSLLRSPESTDKLLHIVEGITGVECLLGQNLFGQHVQTEIVDRIKGALFVIADVTERSVNPLIEAGVAIGAGVRLHLVAAGEVRAPRFMFRDREIHFYRDDLELIGKLHRISRPYRRRVLNREFQARLQ